MEGARVAITGFGAVSPLGLTSTQMWEGLCSGRCGISGITAFDPAGFDCKIAGQAPQYKIQKHVPKVFRKITKLMSRDIELSVIAAEEARASSGLVTRAVDGQSINVDPRRVGINIGAGLISCDLEELAPAVAASVTDGRFDIRKWGKQGIEQVTPLWLLKYLPNMLACHISIIHDIQGPSNTITCAEASSHLAISEAAQTIARGAAIAVFAGGAEAKVNPIVLLRQVLLNRATTQNNDNPETACRPFDADAKGSVFGEGAGVLVVESLENAEKRDARVYAEIVGIGSSNSINQEYHRLEPDGEGIRIAVQNAIEQAGIEPAQLDLIIPHGTAIPGDDLAEARALEAALGQAIADVPVWPTKSMLSNTGAASGALDVIAAICAIRDGSIPAAKNCDNKAPGCNLNIVTEPQQRRIKYALVCSYTYGGQTAAVVLKNPDKQMSE